MFFAGEKRTKIKETNPEMSFGEIQTVIGDAWKKVKNTENSKKWDSMATKDKKRYQDEIAEYKREKVTGESNKVRTFGNLSK
jgi:predicted RNase H-like nuclease